MPAFRCKNCGCPHDAAYAGVRNTPTSCRVCGAGVVFLNNGTKTTVPDNWEILSAATPERLAEIGLTADEVERHEPLTAEQDAAADLERIKANHAALEAKEADWQANADGHIDEWTKTDQALQAAEEALERNADHDAVGRLTDKVHCLKQRLRDIEAKEFTDRDAAHKNHLRSRMTGHEAMASKSAKPFARRPANIAAHAVEGAVVANKPKQQ